MAEKKGTMPKVLELQNFNSVSEVVSFLNVSARHLYNVIASGRLGCVRVGTLVRIRREHVERYLAENTKEAKA